MKLLDSVEDIVLVDGTKYQCNDTVPAVLLYFELMKDKGLTDIEKIETAYQLLVKPQSQRGDNINRKIKVVSEIYKHKISNGKSEELNDKSSNFDFDQDDDLIYSSILQQYSINIRDKKVISNLRWRDFMSLFANLGSKTPFGQAVLLRGVKIKDDMTDEQKNYYREMKRKYRLKKKEENISFGDMDLPHKMAYLAKLRKEGR